MIFGVHAIIFTRDADRARAFFRDVLNFPYVDAHDGWLIFALPPAELGIHPSTKKSFHQLYLLCEDIDETVRVLHRKGVEFASPISEEGYGYATSIKIPGGGELGLYQPKHKMAIRSRVPASRPRAKEE